MALIAKKSYPFKEFYHRGANMALMRTYNEPSTADFVVVVKTTLSMYQCQQGQQTSGKSLFISRIFYFICWNVFVLQINLVNESRI